MTASHPAVRTAAMTALMARWCRATAAVAPDLAACPS